MADSPKLQQKIEETVVEILKNSNMDETTEYKVRKMASEKLGLDLSPPERKQFVRKVVESYLADLQSKAEAARQAEEEEPEEEDDEEGQRKGKRGGAKEYDDDGDLIICRTDFCRMGRYRHWKASRQTSFHNLYKQMNCSFGNKEILQIMASCTWLTLLMEKRRALLKWCSRVEGGEVYFDDRSLRLFKSLITEDVGADLNEGFDTFIEKKGSEGFGDLLTCIRNKNVPLQNMHFMG